MRDHTMLLAACRAVYDSLETLADACGPEVWDTPTGCPGWSVADQFAHVVGVESVMAGDPQPEHPLPDGLAHVRNEFGRLMEIQVDARRDRSRQALLGELHDVFARRRAWLDGLDAAALDAVVPGPLGEAPTHVVLGLRVFDLYAHEQDVRRAVGRPGHEQGPAPRLVRDRILKGLARVLVDRLGATSATLVIEVTGPQARSVAIDLASGSIDEPPAAADVRITVGLTDLLAIAAGRSDAPHDVPMVGDRALGGRVLAAAAITP